MAPSLSTTKSATPTAFWRALAFLFRRRSSILATAYLAVILPSCDSKLLPENDTPRILAEVDFDLPRLTAGFDATRHGLDDPASLVPGGSLFLALRLGSGADERAYAVCLAAEWRRGVEPYRRMAGELLVEHEIRLERYADAEVVAAGLIGRYGGEPTHRLRLVEALHRQERDDRVLRETADFSLSKRLSAAESAELSYYRAVSAARLDEADWPGDVVLFFSEHQASGLHSEALAFLRSKPGADGRFSSGQLLLLEAAASLADRRHRDAADAYQRLLLDGAASGDEAVAVTDAFVANALSAFRLSGRLRAGADVFGDAGVRFAERARSAESASDGDESIEHQLWMAAGQLSRWAGRTEEAKKRFVVAASLGDDAQRKRALWYLFDAEQRSGIDAALRIVPEVLSSPGDRTYFDDVFEELITALAAAGRWLDLYRLYLVVEGAASAYVVARTAFICAAAGASGLLSVGEPESRRLFRRARDVSPHVYYEIAASAILGLSTPRLEEAVRPTGRVAAPPETGARAPGDGEALIRGFLAFELYEEAYRFALLAAREACDAPADVLVDAARALRDSGRYIESIRLMNGVARAGCPTPSADAAVILHPRAFEREHVEAARESGVPIEMLFALVREESYFSPTIVSHAGAIGLAQLMPATAAEVAGRMRIPSPDLMDPATNVRIGAVYLARMYSRFSAWLPAIGAYNAGPSRMQTWLARFGNLPPVLFLEAVPFRETREHMRKVLASAAVYGYLYEGVPPAETFHRSVLRPD